MLIELARECEGVLPSLRASMEAGCEDIEVVGAVVPRARIALRRTRSLKVDTCGAVLSRNPQNVLTFYEE
jgi:hypothetical protein